MTRAESPPRDTRADIFEAAATSFSARGFDGVSVDDIAKQARVNKAMIYYHFADKLALYREVVAEMMQGVGAAVSAIADTKLAPNDKLNRFIETFLLLQLQRPWFPTLMLREIAEGAPHLDIATLGHLRGLIGAFGRILLEGQAAGVFRPIHPVLAYTSVVGPLIFNAARERVAARHGPEFPMSVKIPPAELLAHMQLVARRMLERL